MGKMFTWLELDSDKRLKLIIEQEGIDVAFEDLKPPVRGYYLLHPTGIPLIGLSNWIKPDRVLIRSTLGEEVGHHKTTPESWRRKPHVLYSTNDRANNLPIEKQALRWAANLLITELEIRWFINDGPGTLDQFAARFGVTPELAAERLNSLKAHNLSLWQQLVWRMETRQQRYRIIG
jgi:Zn-dependent peptidase ImmA (M78 family)